MRISRIALTGAYMAAFPAVAVAHPLKGVGDFYAGMLHPLTSLEFVLPLIALALFAGQQRRVAAILALGAFPVSVVAGAAFGAGLHISLGSLPGAAEWFGPATMAVAGLSVALALQGPAVVVATLFSVFGFILGSTQGVEITSAMSAPKFILGAGCTALIVVAYGIGLVRRLRRPWAHVAVRVIGSWVAAAGLMVLALPKSHVPR